MFRVQVKPRKFFGVALTLSVQAPSWVEAIRCALSGLRQAMDAGDRDGLADCEFSVVDVATGHQYILRSMAELKALEMRGTSAARSDMPDAEGGVVARRPRPADDLVKTVDNPRGWQPRSHVDSLEAPASFLSDRLRPTKRSMEKGNAPRNLANRGQFARVHSWTNPSAEVSEIVGKAVDMTWDHIPCEVVQCFIPMEEGHCYSVAASRGGAAGNVIGTRLELPDRVQDLTGGASEPVVVSGKPTRFIYERPQGSIISFEATHILWVPVIAHERVVAVLAAMNPKRSATFTEGDLKGALYLAATLSRQLT